jgi:osmoprotectant transport system ATP-binding protein
MVSNESTLQDALEAILTEGGSAVVTGARGEYVGVVEIDTVMTAVRQLRDDHNGDAA